MSAGEERSPLPVDGEQLQDEHKVFCDCAVPRCIHCGLAVDLRRQASEEEANAADILLTLGALKQLVQNTLHLFSMDEVGRNCQHICVSYSCQLQGLQSTLASSESKKDLIDRFCDKVGLIDVKPLISLMDLLSMGSNSEPVFKCKEVLLQHQTRTKQEGLSQCIECTSPPRSPIYQYLYSRPNFLFFSDLKGLGESPKSSPVSSTGSPTHNIEQHSLLPSDILQRFYNSLEIEVQPTPESENS